MVRFGFIVLNFEATEMTNRCVESVAKTSSEQDYVVVVDSSHNYKPYTEDSYEVVTPDQYNPGFAAAMNVGARRALEVGAEVLVFINNDTTFDENFRETIDGAFQELSKSVAAVGPKIVYMSNPNYVWSAGGEISTTKMKALQVNNGSKADTIKGRFETDFLSGCVVAFRATAFREVGGWPEAYFLGGEEWEISKRLRDLGYDLVIESEAIIYHDAGPVTGHGQSHSFDDVRFVVSSFLNRLVFCSRNYSWFRCTVFRVILCLYIAIIVPFRWENVGEVERLSRKLGRCLQLASYIAFRDGTARITMDELENVGGELIT